MKPYNGHECLVGKTVVIIGGSKGMLMVLLKDNYYFSAVFFEVSVWRPLKAWRVEDVK